MPHALLENDLLRQVSEDFQFLRFYPGIVQLGLAGAYEVDSDDDGLAWFKDGSNPTDSTLKSNLALFP